MKAALGFAIVLALLADLATKRSSTPVLAEKSSCGNDMVEVDGDYCPAVEQYCAQYTDAKQIARDRCSEFKPTGRCFGKPLHKHFCVDRYEWPNRFGTKPEVAMTWDEAKTKCEAVGKRLCEDKEWTLACEGQERLPYPYGYSRNPEACNIDRPYIMPDNEAFGDPKRREQEILRVDQRDPSGTRASCVSPFGVHDMTGNVDEWVMNEAGKEKDKPYKSGLKGGYWGPVRNRCRPITTDHNQWHIGYQIGFRCCADAR
jgi:formylglycine-generating enzyme required for sulfatase activity